MYSATRNDVKKYAAQIEALAKEVQSKIDSNSDFMNQANELVRNSNTFVFALGEVFALEQTALNVKPTTQTTVQATVVKAGNKNYHNVRDSYGRFASKV